MIRRGIAAVFAVCLLAASVQASAQSASAPSFSPFTVRDIRVEGLQRTEPGTVFTYLPVKVGETMNEEKAQQALRALFATGFFRDVRLEVENDVLVVMVDERPAVAQIDLVGIKEFDADTMKRILRDAGLSEGRTFDRAILDPSTGGMRAEFVPESTTGGPGDKLHPNRAGYLAMGLAIDLDMLIPKVKAASR